MVCVFKCGGSSSHSFKLMQHINCFLLYVLWHGAGTGMGF